MFYQILYCITGIPFPAVRLLAQRHNPSPRHPYASRTGLMQQGFRQQKPRISAHARDRLSGPGTSPTVSQPEKTLRVSFHGSLSSISPLLTGSILTLYLIGRFLDGCRFAALRAGTYGMRVEIRFQGGIRGPLEIPWFWIV